MRTPFLWIGLAILLLLVAIGAAFWREQNPAWAAWQARYNAESEKPGFLPSRSLAENSGFSSGIQALVPTSTGKPELCTTCHIGIEDISASHPAQVMGCVVCHGGDPLALDQERAHATLRGGRNPSDLSVAAESCGQPSCHGGYADLEQNHVTRVVASLQATYAGGIATVRYTFGAQDSPRAELGIHAVQDESADLAANAVPFLREFVPSLNSFEEKFQANCLNGGCHLWAEPQAQPYMYRSTGCAACHYLYSDDGLYRGSDPTIPRDEPGHGLTHQLTTAIPYNQCDHCHNRGNYSLKQMSLLARPDLPPAANPIPATMPPEGRRLKEYYQPIAEFTKCEVELNCVDCHTAREAMGDGHIYGSKKDAQSVQCQTCHGTPTSAPHFTTIRDPNELAMRQARINGHADYLTIGDQIVESARGEPWWSIKQTAVGELSQLNKVTGELYNVPLVMGSKCEQNGTDQSSQYCHQCHAVAK